MRTRNMKNNVACLNISSSYWRFFRFPSFVFLRNGSFLIMVSSLTFGSSSFFWTPPPHLLQNFCDDFNKCPQWIQCLISRSPHVSQNFCPAVSLRCTPHFAQLVSMYAACCGDLAVFFPLNNASSGLNS